MDHTYLYFVAYIFEDKKGKSATAQCTLRFPKRISTTDDIDELNDAIKEHEEAKCVVVINFIELGEVS